MKISTRGRYSLRMMLDLAQNGEAGYVSLKDISERQGISKKYLEQIIPFLNRSNLLLTNRGHQGGYKLSKKPADITIYDILISAEGSLSPVSCMDDEQNQCDKCNDCMTLPVWNGLYKVVKEYLSSITLQDVLLNGSNADDYVI